MTDEEIQKQLEDGQPVQNSNDAVAYKLLFSLLREEPESNLRINFEKKVISRLNPSYLFSGKEILGFIFLILFPVCGMIYWSDIAKEISGLPTMKWLADHVLEISFGIILIVIIQLADRLLKKKFHMVK